MAETDPGGLADHLEEEADDLERHSQELGEKTKDVSQDWERKRADPGIPGAPPPASEEQSEDEDESPAAGAPAARSEPDDDR